MSSDKLKQLEKSFTLQERTFILTSINLLKVDQIASLLNKKQQKIEEFLLFFNPADTYEFAKKLYSSFKRRKNAKVKEETEEKETGIKRKRGRNNKAGYREDLGIFVRSKMEANMLRYLSSLYKRENINYEEAPFSFEKSKTKIKGYLPDFKITTNDQIFYIEVKGFLNSGDSTKLKYMKKEYPNVIIKIVTKSYNKKVIELANKLGYEVIYYDKIEKEFKKILPNWE